MKFFKNAVLCFACLTGSSASAQEVVIDDRFDIYVMDWNEGPMGIVRWSPALIEGKIAICGAFSVQGGGSNRFGITWFALKHMRARNGAGFMMPDMSFFKQVSAEHFESALHGELANCRVSRQSGTAQSLENMELKQTRTKY